MKFNSVFLSTLLIFSVVQMGVNTPVLAFEQNSDERWFEVEVILFKQLGDKKLLKEQFPDNVNASNLPQYSQSFDLLTEYLQPNLSNIKQFIPHCGESNKQPELLTTIVDQLFPNALAPLRAFEDQHTSAFDNEAQAIESDLALQSKQTLAEQALAEQTLTEQTLATQFKSQKEALAQPIFSNFSAQNICIISQDKMKEMFGDQALANTNPDAFDVESLPSRLNAVGVHRSQPYLIADESLLLKDIGQSLRWSREFRPLLHFGWRQVGLTQSKSIPVKLIAGENLAYQYEQALAEYQQQLAQKSTMQQALFNQLTPAQQMALKDTLNNQQALNNEAYGDDNTAENKAAYKQRLLNELFTNINAVDERVIINKVNQLNSQTLDSILSDSGNESSTNELTVNQDKKPKAPLQPWFLDGFFNVHLDHYLYITADFNVLNKTVTSADANTDTDNDTSDLKLINFNQNRRVITGEIHYFDHPYIGMIVQIRRFDPTKPADEAVSQAVN